jgi:hypothetical protein
VPFPNPDGTTTVEPSDLYKRDCFVLEAELEECMAVPEHHAPGASGQSEGRGLQLPWSLIV